MATVVTFGLVALALGCGIYAIVIWKGKAKGITFMRLYALIVLAALAVMLAIADVDTDAKVAAFTLLGTIAGYLAGARTPETQTTTTVPPAFTGTSSGTGAPNPTPLPPGAALTGSAGAVPGTTITTREPTL